MWGFQPHFRLSLERLARSALNGIGAPLDPRAYLVGFAAGERATHPVCVEPEDGPFTAGAFATVLDDGRARFVAHEDYGLINTDPDVHRRNRRGLLDRCEADALVVAMQQDPAGVDRLFFAGRSLRVGEYQVFPVLGVLRGRWEALPTLRTSRRDRLAIPRSLPEAVLTAVLRTASASLARAEPPSEVLTIGSRPSAL